jgi:hypothetical protein
MQDQHIAQLIDSIRDLDAQAAGKRMELALALGDRDEARRQMREMNALTQARIAAREAVCVSKVH